MMMMASMFVNILFPVDVINVSAFAAPRCLVAASFIRTVFISQFQTSYLPTPLSRLVPGCV